MISIDIENFDKYKKYNFDILITFSSYHSDPAVCPLEQIKWEKRIKTKTLNSIIENSKLGKKSNKGVLKVSITIIKPTNEIIITKRYDKNFEKLKFD